MLAGENITRAAHVGGELIDLIDAIDGSLRYVLIAKISG